MRSHHRRDPSLRRGRFGALHFEERMQLPATVGWCTTLAALPTPRRRFESANRYPGRRAAYGIAVSASHTHTASKSSDSTHGMHNFHDCFAADKLPRKQVLRLATHADAPVPSAARRSTSMCPRPRTLHPQGRRTPPPLPRCWQFHIRSAQ